MLARTFATAAAVWMAALPAGAAVLEVPAQYPTIQAAVDASAPDDVVRVSPGTYFETITVTAHDLTLESVAGPSQTFLEPTGDGHWMLEVGPALGRATTIAGFTFRGAFIEDWDGAVRLAGPVQVRHCVFEDNVASAPASSFHIGAGGGISATAAVHVEDCVFRDNRSGYYGGALWVTLDGDETEPLVVRENVFTGNVSEQGAALAVLAFDHSVHPARIERNTFVEQRGEFSVVSLAADVEFRGNIVYQHEEWSGLPLACHLWLHVRPAESGIDYDHIIECNLFHHPDWPDHSFYDEFCPVAALDETPTFDPEFCDVAVGDYRLQPTSPAAALPCGPIGAFGVGCALVGVGTSAGDTGARVAFASAVPARVGTASRLAVRLDRSSSVRIDIFDASGRRLSTVPGQPLSAGIREVAWRPTHGDVGVRFLRVVTDHWTETRKVQVLP